MKENITALHNDYAILSVSNDPTIESNEKEHIIVHLTKLAKAVKCTKQKRLQQLSFIRPHDRGGEEEGTVWLE